MTDTNKSPSRWQKWIKLTVMFSVIALFALIYFNFGDQLSLSELAKHETSLRDFRVEHPILVYALAFGIYVLVSSLSLPGGATVLSLAYAWFLGFWPALLLVSFASTTGATFAFLLSRYLFRDMMLERFGSRLTAFNEALEKEGAFYLFSLRLIPLFPFWIINLVMGLTPIKVGTYWWVSQVGMLPGTAVYLFAGSQVPSLNKLATEGPGDLFPILLAFALLGLMPLAFKQVMKLVRARMSHPAGPNGTSD